MKCQHCSEPVIWDTYWTTWEHAKRPRQLTSELCEPDKGFDHSKYATPTFGE